MPQSSPEQINNFDFRYFKVLIENITRSFNLNLAQENALNQLSASLENTAKNSTLDVNTINSVLNNSAFELSKINNESTLSQSQAMDQAAVIFNQTIPKLALMQVDHDLGSALHYLSNDLDRETKQILVAKIIKIQTLNSYVASKSSYEYIMASVQLRLIFEDLKLALQRTTTQNIEELNQIINELAPDRFQNWELFDFITKNNRSISKLKDFINQNETKKEEDLISSISPEKIKAYKKFIIEKIDEFILIIKNLNVSCSTAVDIKMLNQTAEFAKERINDRDRYDDPTQILYLGAIMAVVEAKIKELDTKEGKIFEFLSLNDVMRVHTEFYIITLRHIATLNLEQIKTMSESEINTAVYAINDDINNQVITKYDYLFQEKEDIPETEIVSREIPQEEEDVVTFVENDFGDTFYGVAGTVSGKRFNDRKQKGRPNNEDVEVTTNFNSEVYGFRDTHLGDWTIDTSVDDQNTFDSRKHFPNTSNSIITEDDYDPINCNLEVTMRFNGDVKEFNYEPGQELIPSEGINELLDDSYDTITSGDYEINQISTRGKVKIKNFIYGTLTLKPGTILEIDFFVGGTLILYPGTRVKLKGRYFKNTTILEKKPD